jgi:hypothetical protein
VSSGRVFLWMFSLAGLLALHCAGGAWADSPSATELVARVEPAAATLSKPRGPAGALSLASLTPLPSEDEDVAAVETVPAESLQPRLHSATDPWVEVSELRAPQDYAMAADAGAFIHGKLGTLSPALFVEKKLEEERYAARDPEYVPWEPASLFHVSPPREEEFARKVKKILRDKMYGEIRRHVKRQWKTQFLDHPSLRQEVYDRRLSMINNIGRDPADYDESNVIQQVNEARQDILQQKGREGELDIPLIEWGPLTVTDSGSLKFDAWSLATGGEAGEAPAPASAGPKPFLAEKIYNVRTDLKLDLDPLRVSSSEGPWTTLKRYGVTVEVTWLSDILAREILSTELEFEADTEGDFGFFASFVIKSR